MAEETDVNGINLDAVQAMLTDEGYETSPAGENTLKVSELESGITLHAVLEENILFCTVTCTVVPSDAITADVMHKMLDAENGISTSGFQLYHRDNGSVAVTLNNFCKLQAMGEDDRDDILSCLQFLVVDVVVAKDLIGDLAKTPATS